MQRFSCSSSKRKDEEKLKEEEEEEEKKGKNTKRCALTFSNLVPSKTF
jgi:hypothetical protein